MTNENSVDDLMSTDMDAEIGRMLEIKKHISNFLNKERLIKFLVDTVKESKCLSFERPNPERYISPSKPMLQLLVDDEAIIKHYGTSTNLVTKIKNKVRLEVIDARSNIVHKELCEVFMELMSELFISITRKDYVSTYDSVISEIFDKSRHSADEVNAIFKDSENIDDYSFIYSLVTAVNFPPLEANLDLDTSCAVEIML